MRYDVHKFLFYGARDDRDLFFRRAQEVGMVEFIDPTKAVMSEQPAEITQLITANKVLRGLEPLPQEELDDIRVADRIAERIVLLQENINRFEEELRVLEQEIARVRIFGDFAPEDLAYIRSRGNRVIQFFFSKHGAVPEVEQRDEVFFVGTAHELDYWIAVNRERVQYPGLVEMYIEEPFGVLVRRKRRTREELRLARSELKTYANRKEFLHKALVLHLNRRNLLVSQDFAREELGGNIFMVEGWVPESKIHLLAPLCDGLSVFFEEIAVEKADSVPTYLENASFARVGEDLVQIYDAPSTTDRDPSGWVFWSFCLFFAMIVGDAGFGLVLLGIALCLRFKFSQAKGSLKRFIKLSLTVSVFCIVWGVMITSYFGISIAPDSPIQKISVVNWMVRQKVNYALSKQGGLYHEWVNKYPQLAEETTVNGWIETAVKEKEGKIEYDLFERFANNVLLELALFVGSIHIILAFARMLDKNWAGIGWILVIIGGYLYAPSVLDATSLAQYIFHVPERVAVLAGLELLCLGLGLAVLLALIQRRLGGALEISVLITIFADVMSYLRLYALGLASALMSVTFNELGATAGVVFGGLIIIVGQSVNLVLSVMGGVIHGLRLNFLEWYHHCFEGGGRMLRPLRLLRTEPG